MDSSNLSAGYQQVEITTRHPRTRGGHAGRAGGRGRVGLRRRPEAWPPRSATALDQAPTVTPEEPHPTDLTAGLVRIPRSTSVADCTEEATTAAMQMLVVQGRVPDGSSGRNHPVRPADVLGAVPGDTR